MLELFRKVELNYAFIQVLDLLNLGYTRIRHISIYDYIFTNIYNYKIRSLGGILSAAKKYQDLMYDKFQRHFLGDSKASLPYHSGC